VESELKTIVPVAVKVATAIPPVQPITGAVWVAPGPHNEVICQVPTTFPPQAEKAVQAAGTELPLLLPLHDARMATSTTPNPPALMRASHLPSANRRRAQMSRPGFAGRLTRVSVLARQIAWQRRIPRP